MTHYYYYYLNNTNPPPPLFPIKKKVEDRNCFLSKDFRWNWIRMPCMYKYENGVIVFFN